MKKDQYDYKDDKYQDEKGMEHVLLKTSHKNWLLRVFVN